MEKPQTLKQIIEFMMLCNSVGELRLFKPLPGAIFLNTSDVYNLSYSSLNADRENKSFRRNYSARKE